jgi:uncharacterized protein DUF4038/collagenase-like protein with putative collagen-binding domain
MKVFAFIILMLLPLVAAATPPMPLAMSANKHYLIDAQGNPFYMIGESSWSIFCTNSGSNAAYYCSTRAAQGFNLIQIAMPAVSYTDPNGNNDGKLGDGTAPFTSGTTPGTFDLSTPNKAFWMEVSNDIYIAETNGLIVVEDPLETGGMLITASNNGAVKCYNYGNYVGNFFANSGLTNIMVQWGNDYNYNTAFAVTNDTVETNLAAGFKAAAPTISQCVEISSINSAVAGNEDSNWWQFMLASGIYTWAPCYSNELAVYGGTNILMPGFGMELGYEGEAGGGYPLSYGDGGLGSSYEVRKDILWTLLSGCTGVWYGQSNVWRVNTGWQTNLFTPGETNLCLTTNILNNFPWWRMVPDINSYYAQSGRGAFVFTGMVLTNDYVACMYDPGRTSAILYFPCNNIVTVNLASSNFVTPVYAKWFDPTVGTTTMIAGSPFLNNGTRVFQPPGLNAQGSNDWVLELTTETGSIANTANTAVQNLIYNGH